MGNMYDETDLTWSSVEKYYDYEKVIWSVMGNGIPVYALEDKNGKKIKINNKML
jgi:hypothetical protein